MKGTKWSSRTTAFVSLALLGLLCDAHAATFCVDSSVPQSGNGTSWATALKTIQEGIDAASEGDAVIVAEGTYVENILFEGKNAVLRCTDPLDPDVVAATVIDGNQEGSVVTFDGTESETCILSGFTIRNGSAWNGGGICGGTGANDTRATVERNVISGNSAEQYGGGIYRCDGLIRYNTISENSCMLGGPWGGGGLCDCDGTIQSNIITGNSADRGGGLAYCNATIENNTISGNSAPGYDSEGGGLVFCAGVIRNNTISDNWASGCGGGFIWCHGPIQNNTVSDNTAAFGAGLNSCDGLIENNSITGGYADRGGGLSYCGGVIRNNVIAGNSSYFHGGGVHDCWGIVENNKIYGNSSDIGAGLYECGGSVVGNLIVGNAAGRFAGGLYRCDGTVQNNTIAYNSAGVRGGGLYACRTTVRNCIVWGNEAGEDAQLDDFSNPMHSCIEGWTSNGEGNISRDPLFLDPDGPDDDPESYGDNDYRFAEGSPCIDAGANEDWMWRGVDLDGRPRILYGGAYLTVDMGAHEYPAKHLVQCHLDRTTINYATGTFSTPVSIASTLSGLEETLCVLLVVPDVAFTVPGPNSEGRLWNPDGVTSEAYSGVAEYPYKNVTALLSSCPEPICRTELEFYIKDRNPNFQPTVELWAFRPVPDSAQSGAAEGSPFYGKAGENVQQGFGGDDVQASRRAFRVEQVVLLPGRAVLLRWNSLQNDVYVVEASSSPTGPWTPISEKIVSQAQFTEWPDTHFDECRQRFYRVCAFPE